MLNVVFCGYRSWAKEIIEKVSLNEKVNCIDKIYSIEEYHNKVNTWNEDIDFILFLGWSWIIPQEITEKFLCIGIHPSDLPNYRGGSPLQHQIINGVVETKMSLMTLSSKKLDGGEIWLKEHLDLRGNNMAEVFDNIIKSSILMLEFFIENFPNITPNHQDLTRGTYYKRRQPEESEITIEDMKNMSLEEMYNFMRALTDPYPNAFIKDDEGNKLYFKEVIFEKKK